MEHEGLGREGQTRFCPPQVAYFQSALDKLNEAIKLAKVKLDTCGCPSEP